MEHNVNPGRDLSLPGFLLTGEEICCNMRVEPDGTRILWDEYKGAEYVYDSEGKVCGMVYEGETYYFVKNLQGGSVAVYALIDLSDHEKALYNLLCLCYIINSGIL
jgi:hypothetical protein